MFPAPTRTFQILQLLTCFYLSLPLLLFSPLLMFVFSFQFCFFCHFHPLDRGFYFTLSRVCLSFTALYLLPSSFPSYPLFSHLFLLASLAFLIKVLEGISSHLLLSPYSVPLLLSLSLPFFPPPRASLCSLFNLSLSWGPGRGQRIVWSWMLILGDRHHMSHSHNHRAPPPPPFWL